MLWGLDFRAWRSEARGFQDLRFEVLIRPSPEPVPGLGAISFWSLRFRVQGLGVQGFRVSGFGFRV